MNTSSVQQGIALSVARHSGKGGRASNQDALTFVTQDSVTCFVVADGAGGHAGGEIASATVVESITEKFLHASACTGHVMASCLDHATARVDERRSAEMQLKDMTATVAMLLIDSETRNAMWTHLGDTRVYLFRRNRIISVTRDHSLVQQFIDAGYCKPEQLRSHPQRSKLFAAIGAQTDTDLVPPQASSAIEDGDVFLVCTDGFWEWVTEDQMEKTLSMANNADDWLAEMTRAVEKNGEVAKTPQDNHTAFAVWIGEPNEVTVRR